MFKIHEQLISRNERFRKNVSGLYFYWLRDLYCLYLLYLHCATMFSMAFSSALWFLFIIRDLHSQNLLFTCFVCAYVTLIFLIGSASEQMQAYLLIRINWFMNTLKQSFPLLEMFPLPRMHRGTWKTPFLTNTCYTYPTMMKIGKVWLSWK